jgi:basic membrane protein A
MYRDANIRGRRAAPPGARVGKGNVVQAKQVVRLCAGLAVGSLVVALSACGSAPPKSSSTPQAQASGKKILACMVTDTGGIDDKSFNSSAWNGLQAAEKANSNISATYVQSTTETDYQPNLTNFTNHSPACNFIVAVGGLMGAATDKVAKATPNTQFGIVDSPSTQTNIYAMQFDTAQAAYLAGYLAAGMSKTGKVGTYGGIKIPPVTIFMDGFADGVAHYNQVKGKNVQVLGWSKASQNGLFANSFTDQAKGKQLGEQLNSQGADIILPVAGGVGLGTAADAQTSGKYAVIWVDQDGCVSAAQYCSVFMTTVQKNISAAVQDATEKVSLGTLSGKGTIGTLANNGVQLAPYHDWASKIPQSLQTEVDQLKQQIISGQVKVTSPAEPTQ